MNETLNQHFDIPSEKQSESVSMLQQLRALKQLKFYRDDLKTRRNLTLSA